MCVFTVDFATTVNSSLPRIKLQFSSEEKKNGFFFHPTRRRRRSRILRAYKKPKIDSNPTEIGQKICTRNIVFFFFLKLLYKVVKCDLKNVVWRWRRYEAMAIFEQNDHQNGPILWDNSIKMINRTEIEIKSNGYAKEKNGLFCLFVGQRMSAVWPPGNGRLPPRSGGQT